MRLGLFMMPLHDPARDFLAVLKEDREAILLADQLGYNEAWVGEHYSCKTEPIPDPLQFMATLVPVTKHITFATGVINLPQHHPAQVAGNVALFDHLAEGRYIMGVGPGGLGSDFELFGTFEKNRRSGGPTCRIASTANTGMSLSTSRRSRISASGRC